MARFTRCVQPLSSQPFCWRRALTFHQPCAFGSPISRPCSSSAATSSDARTGADVGLLLNAENTYLSWTRNAFICTSAGVLIIQYNADYSRLKRLPNSGLSMLSLGGMFMLAGSFSYMRTHRHLARIIRLHASDWSWICFNAICPPLIWFFGMRCFLLGTPERLARWLAAHQDDPNIPIFLKSKSPSTTDRIQHQKTTTMR